VIRIAFRYGDKRLFSRLVCLFQGGDSAHCEAAWSWRGATHDCVSASFLDGGVRRKAIALSPAKWRVYEVPGEPLEVVEWYGRHAREGYDWLGLMGFVFRRIKGFANRKFCSEACASIMGLPDAHRYDLALLESVCMRYGRRVSVDDPS
jgi:hypothetical protein